MSEIIINRLKESEGKEITIFLHNDFRFSGTCLNSDDTYLELFDYKTNSLKVIEIIQIKELEVKE